MSNLRFIFAEISEIGFFLNRRRGKLVVLWMLEMPFHSSRKIIVAFVSSSSGGSLPFLMWFRHDTPRSGWKWMKLNGTASKGRQPNPNRTGRATPYALRSGSQIPPVVLIRLTQIQLLRAQNGVRTLKCNHTRQNPKPPILD